MGRGSIIICIIIAIVAICIYFIKNKEIILSFLEKINSLKKRKIKKIMITLLIILLIIFVLMKIISNFKSILENIEDYKQSKIYDEIFESSDQKIYEENDFYREIINKEYKNQNYDKPYLPQNFEYVEGEYSTGYVIQDENKNQYVWVPCTNKEIDGIVKLEKRNFVDKAFISKDSCYNEEYKEFLQSALENGGFYISRFEIGKENSLPVSKKDVEVWQGVTRKESIEIIKTMYSDDEIHCRLINGYAYDTVLQWIKDNNEIKKDIWNLQENKVIYSGRNEYNKIFDFIDNVMELTLETSYNTVIIRGFSSGDTELDYGIKFSDESRYSIFEENNDFNLQDALTFRTILYK